MTLYDQSIDRAGALPLIPEEVTAEVFQNVTKKSAFMQLGRQLPNFSRGQLRMPVLTGLITAGFVSPTDVGLKITSKASWTNKYVTAEEVAAIIPVPASVLDDMDYDLWTQLRPQIEEAFGAVIDAAVFSGTGKPSSWPEGIAPAAVTASNSADLSSIGNAFDAIMGTSGIIAKVEEDGYLVNGHVAATTMRAKLRGLRSGGTSDIPLFMSSLQGATQYQLDGAPILFPQNGSIDPSTYLQIAGDWNQAVWAIRQELTAKVLDQAVITDDAGVIVVNLAQQDMVALRVVMRMGWQLPNPPTRENPTTGFPFAVLVP